MQGVGGRKLPAVECDAGRLGQIGQRARTNLVLVIRRHTGGVLIDHAGEGIIALGRRRTVDIGLLVDEDQHRIRAADELERGILAGGRPERRAFQIITGQTHQASFSALVHLIPAGDLQGCGYSGIAEHHYRRRVGRGDFGQAIVELDLAGDLYELAHLQFVIDLAGVEIDAPALVILEIVAGRIAGIVIDGSHHTLDGHDLAGEIGFEITVRIDLDRSDRHDHKVGLGIRHHIAKTVGADAVVGDQFDQMVIDAVVGDLSGGIGVGDRQPFWRVGRQNIETAAQIVARRAEQLDHAGAG